MNLPLVPFVQTSMFIGTQRLWRLTEFVNTRVNAPEISVLMRKNWFCQPIFEFPTSLLLTFSATNTVSPFLK